MVTVLSMPTTFQGKQIALQQEIKENFNAYFEKAASARMWFPDRLAERDEMAQYRDFISDSTKEILLGFLGVESYVDDYVFCGIQSAGDNFSTRALYIQWGFEERRHGQTFRNCLIDSGLYTQEFVDNYLAHAAEYRWTFNEQTGYDVSPLLASAYAIFQERHTRWNYTYTRMRIWEEYGSPTDGDGRREFPAIAGAIRFPETDEGAHEANFTNIVRIYMKYFPELALDALLKVSNHYKMPVVQLPNAEEFISCVLAAGMGNPRDVINEVVNPSLSRMGLENRQALRTAAKNFSSLPEDAFVQVAGKRLPGVPENAKVYDMLPTGEFQLSQNTNK